jgi:hypothetical protein
MIFFLVEFQPGKKKKRTFQQVQIMTFFKGKKKGLLWSHYEGNKLKSPYLDNRLEHVTKI